MLPDKPAGAGGDSDLSEAGRVIATFVFLVVLLAVVPNWGCKRDPLALWNPPPEPRDRRNRWGFEEPDPAVAAERERREARLRFEEDTARLKTRLDEREQKVRTFDTEDEYLDAVGMADALSREYREASRLGRDAKLRGVQAEAVRAACRIAKLKAVRFVGRDEYAAAARVMDGPRADVGTSAGSPGSSTTATKGSCSWKNSPSRPNAPRSDPHTSNRKSHE